MNKQADDVRREVSKTCAAALAAPTKSGCCGSSSTSAGSLVKLGGYSREDLAVVPDQAAANSFGCGNPLAMAGLRHGDVVLDRRSGAGIDLFLAAKRVGPSGRVIGVDMTDEMLAKERARVGQLARGLAGQVWSADLYARKPS